MGCGDQDHYGGTDAVDSLARLAGIDDNCHVLDVCSGMGGPARYLAHRYGCRVSGLDLTRSRVEAARNLTRMAGLEGLVDFRHGNALENPFADEDFDVVISQEAFAHIPDKARLISECVRVTRGGGQIVFTDILARDGLSEDLALRLGQEMRFAGLETEAGYAGLLRANGCDVLEIEILDRIWTELLVDRLAMYRGLKEPTVARFGAAQFETWDNAYGFFVDLFQAGKLGGCRIHARRAAGTEIR